MPEPDLVLIFSEPLDRLGMAYMVTGSVASMAYGEPRLTNDVDLVLALSAATAGKLVAAFPLDSFYCPPLEVLTVEARRERRGRFNLIHHQTGCKADVYVAGQDPLHAWAFSRRKRLEIGAGTSFWLAQPEYVIVRKLEYYREGGSEKHLRDIRGMLAASGDILDRQSLEEWVRVGGLQEQWCVAQKSP